MKGVGAGNCPHLFMGSVKVYKGTYGYVSAIFDTNVYNFFVNAGGVERYLFQNLKVTDFGNQLLSVMAPYISSLHYTFLHNLRAGEFDPATTSLWEIASRFLGNLHYSEDFFNADAFSEFSPNAGRYIKIEPGSNTPYTPYCWYSLDGTSTFGLQNNAPFGYINKESNQLAFAIGVTVFNDDGTQNRTAVFSSTAYASAMKMWAAGQNNPAYFDWFDLLVPYDETADPYNTGGNTEPSPKPPAGDFDNTSDPIDVSTLPTLSAVNTRFISLFKPDLTQLQSLASYMWGASFDLETFKKLFNDPMAAILGLSIVPVDPPAAAAAPITLGNITTTISMPKITSQYVQVPCGTLNVNEYWGAYLDYSPFTKLEIYLPYIGVQTLDADDIMGRSVEVVYNIDVLSGACVAQLKCGDSVLYSFAGSCAVSIPITGRDWTNMINGIIGVATAAAGIAVAGATGGASVAAAAAGGALSQTANSLSSMKPTVQKSGTMAAGSGMLAIQKPYLILTRPRQALPENQNKYTGYPSFITATLGDLTGMTYVYEIHLENVDCTQAEQAEIETLLKNGVIL